MSNRGGRKGDLRAKYLAVCVFIIKNPAFKKGDFYSKDNFALLFLKF